MLAALITSECVLPVGDGPGEVRSRDVDRYALEAYRRLKKNFIVDFDLLVLIGRSLRDGVTRLYEEWAGLPSFDDLRCNHEAEIEFICVAFGDDAWGEEHVLKPISLSDDVAATKILTVRFRARRSGAVFLYFNDVVIGFVRDPFNPFYNNNSNYIRGCRRL